MEWFIALAVLAVVIPSGIAIRRHNQRVESERGIFLPQPVDPSMATAAARTANLSMARYPDLHRAGDMLRGYGRFLRGSFFVGLTLAGLAIAYGIANSDHRETASTAYSVGFYLFTCSLGSLASGALFAAVGQGCVALADIAANSENTAEALRRVSE